MYLPVRDGQRKRGTRVGAAEQLKGSLLDRPAVQDQLKLVAEAMDAMQRLSLSEVNLMRGR